MAKKAPGEAGVFAFALRKVHIAGSSDQGGRKMRPPGFTLRRIAMPDGIRRGILAKTLGGSVSCQHLASAELKYSTDDYNFWVEHSIEAGSVNPKSFRRIGPETAFYGLAIAFVGTWLFGRLRKRYLKTGATQAAQLPLERHGDPPLK